MYNCDLCPTECLLLDHNRHDTSSICSATPECAIDAQQDTNDDALRRTMELHHGGRQERRGEIYKVHNCTPDVRLYFSSFMLYLLLGMILYYIAGCCGLIPLSLCLSVKKNYCIRYIAGSQHSYNMRHPRMLHADWL